MDFQLGAAQQALKARARALADGVFRARAARWDADEEYPWDNVKDLVAAGFMGLAIPREYGGSGGSLLDVLLVVEEIARVCGVTARIVVEGNVGAVGALIAYGTDAQKRRYLPWVLEGDKPAIAITEPEAGSAATDLVTRADEVPEGWALHGEKRWITGAGVSRLHLVYCRMREAPGAEGIGLSSRRARPHDGASGDSRGTAAFRRVSGVRRAGARRSARRLQEADERLQ